MDVCFVLLLLTSILSCTTPISQQNTTQTTEDPIDVFKIDSPKDGDVVQTPVKFAYHVTVNDVGDFKQRYAGMQYCVEVDGDTTACKPMFGRKVRFTDLSEGTHSAVMFITDEFGISRFHQTPAISFTVVSPAAFERRCAERVERYRVENGLPKDEHILQWAERQPQWIRGEDKPIVASFQDKATKVGRSMLVIGIKSAVLTNFDRRQAIRETWGNVSALPENIKVFFLGCTPVMDDISSSSDRERFKAAVELERKVFGDLLTDELDCEDSRAFLGRKVTGFADWVVANLPQTSYIFIVDDDVYAKVDKIVADLSGSMPRDRIYLGESLEVNGASKLIPLRDPMHRYFTSRPNYPLDQFAPYAAGPHFILSMDCARFLARNCRRLGSLGGLDDNSMGIWLLTIQVHVQYTQAFRCLRLGPCADNLLSIADLSPLGIRSMHNNRLRGRSLCHHFDSVVWGWQPPGSAKDLLDKTSMQ